MNSTAYVLTGILLIAPAIVAVYYGTSVYSQKLIANKFYQRPLLRALINVLLLSLIPLVVIVIVAIINFIGAPMDSEALIGLILIGVSVALPMLLTLSSSRYLAKACLAYKTEKSRIDFNTIIKLYVAICILLTIFGVYSVYSAVLDNSKSSGVPGVVILIGPVYFVLHAVTIGYITGFLMYVHQSIIKKR